MRHLVAGGGGFIGSHLARRLLDEGHEVVVADVREYCEWEQTHDDALNWYEADLADSCAARVYVHDVDAVWNVSASMGGMGHIQTHEAECAANIAIDVALLNACRETGADYFFAGSACAYSAEHQTHDGPTHLAEWMVKPYDPEPGYGWSKLMGEKLAEYYAQDYGLRTRVARYHNIYGPHCAWTGGREKAPAAICRKVAEAVISGGHEIEVWGDGTQARSFCYVDDCVEGTLRLMASDVDEPLNIGSSETVTVDELVSVVELHAGVALDRIYMPDAPKGVPARSSDNTMILERLKWEPSTPLVNGMGKLWAWVYDQVKAQS